MVSTVILDEIKFIYTFEKSGKDTLFLRYEYHGLLFVAPAGFFLGPVCLSSFQ